MAADQTVSLILPAYNEAQTIGQTVAEALAYLAGRGADYEVIVVAEGEDGTGDVAAGIAAGDAHLRVIAGKQRAGKGRAIRGAVAIAQKEVVGFADADNKTPIEELDKLLLALDDGCDLAIGSRALAKSRIERSQSIYRRAGSRVFRHVMHLATGLRDIPDTQCGFKFFRRDVARDLFARQRIDGYMFDVEILYLAKLAGYRLAQVPIRWRDDGDSRLQLVSGNLRNARDILGIRLSHRKCASS